MTPLRHALRLVLALACLWLIVPIANGLEEVRCDKSLAFLAGSGASEQRQYAPDRKMDILNLALEVTPDFKRRTISGKATFTFKPIAQPLAEIRLDAVDLAIQSVTGSARIAGYQSTDQELVITFADPIPTGKESTLTIVYSAEPARGLYFRTPEMGYKDGDTHLFTQGEPIEARHWYPCFDSPNEKFTSEVTCFVPAGMTVLSNGKLVSETNDSSTGLTAVHWRQDKPHVNYLISLLAGYFKKIEDQYRGIPLAFYTPASDIAQATSSFRGTREAMAFFEKETGYPYPWAKYDQVCVNDFHFGGMENTSITTLTDSTLFTEASEEIESSEGLMAHELAHQWFGDLVTCKDWSHIWLNEGFATYYAHLFAGHQHGRDELLYGLYGDARSITSGTGERKAMVKRQFGNPMEQFAYDLAYAKGSWVVHMLRSQLGEDLYRRCIQTYLERHQFENAVTEDLNAVIEELSGRSFDRFFDQWVYHAHHPELEINYGWDERTKLAKVSLQQVQKLSDSVLLFQFPLTVRFYVAGRTIDRQVLVQEKSEDFYFPLTAAPELVRIDPELTLLAKVRFTPPEPMLRVQLTNQTDVIGRVLAIEQLSSRRDRATVDRLTGVLKGDAFYAVRIEAARALRSIHSDESFQALVDALDQKDARVRREVLSAVSAFFRDEAYQTLWARLYRERNPDIVASILEGLAPYARPEIRDALVSNLHADSYRSRLASAAIGTMRAQNDPALIKPLQEGLRDRQTQLPPFVLSRGLNTLAYLARNEDNKESVRNFILGFVNHPNRNLREAALSALGTLADPRSIPVLRTFVHAGKDNPERATAERALSSLREAKKPADEQKDLRNEVLDLQKETRELKKQFQELQKKLEALETPGPGAKAEKAGAK